jgi:hypothetical protein
MAPAVRVRRNSGVVVAIDTIVETARRLPTLSITNQGFPLSLAPSDHARCGFNWRARKWVDELTLT